MSHAQDHEHEHEHERAGGHHAGRRQRSTRTVRAARAARRLTRQRRAPASQQAPLNLEPSTAYEVLTRQMVDDLTRDVAATRQRVDTMFYLVIGSVLLDVLLRV